MRAQPGMIQKQQTSLQRFKRSSSPNRGFTFIELLVVLGLITVLGLVLLPARATTGRNVSMMMCKENLRQVGWAIDMYTKDHGEYLPGPLWSGIFFDYENGGTGKIGSFLAPYFGLPPQDNTVRQVPVLKCPGFFEVLPNTVPGGGLNGPICYFSNPTITNSPSPNLQTMNYPFGRPSSPTSAPLKMSAIKRPSENWAMTDADQQNVPSGSTYYSYIPSKPVHSLRPGPTKPNAWRNYLYFDWSVRFQETTN